MGHNHSGMSKQFHILALGGDGIGPEVTEAALSVAEAAARLGGLDLNITRDLLHGACWDQHGVFIRDETLALARSADAILVGAVGGPKWDGLSVPGGPEMQDGLMRLRFELETFLGLRPAKAMRCLNHLSPYRPGLADNADILVLREMCGGAFFTQTRGVEGRAGRRRGYDLMEYSEPEISRFAQAGFAIARRRGGRLCSVDKSNVMLSNQLWRDVVTETGANHQDVELTHLFADNASYQIARNPEWFDVILADNLFGDLLSDQAATVAGGLGMLPSACLTGAPSADRRAKGLFEPVHGSAPDIAGQGVANPIGAILSAAMMFDYALGRPDLARRIETAAETALSSGALPPDLGGTARTGDVTGAVLAAL